MATFSMNTVLHSTDAVLFSSYFGFYFPFTCMLVISFKHDLHSKQIVPHLQTHFGWFVFSLFTRWSIKIDFSFLFLLLLLKPFPLLKLCVCLHVYTHKGCSFSSFVNVRNSKVLFYLAGITSHSSPNLLS